MSIRSAVVLGVPIAALLVGTGARPRTQETPLPPFCEKVALELQGGVAIPYEVRQVGDRLWCEGVLSQAAGVRASVVESIKQLQPAVALFSARATTTLSWCDSHTPDSTDVRLRSLSNTLYALDARGQSRFDWPLAIVAQLEPNWTLLTARVTRRMIVNNQPRVVWFPVRVGIGYSDSYVFLLSRDEHLLQALIKPMSSSAAPTVKDVAPRDAGGATEIQLTFSGMPEGIYRISFSELATDGGLTSEPVYIYHRQCSRE